MGPHFHVLGPLRAEIDRKTLELGGPQQRSVLALLLIARGHVVSVDRLIDHLWAGEPPPKAIASLQVYVSHLRRQLEPGRLPRAPARVLVSTAPGYALTLPGDVVDAWRFEDALRHARPDATPAALAQLQDALSWWRGRPYADLADQSWAVQEVARLNELHHQARELVAGGLLRTGKVHEAVTAATALAREDSLREEGWRLLALALWGAGRQAEALAALREAAGVMAEELGLPPGPALAQLERAMLEHRHEVLQAAISGPVVPATTAPTPTTLSSAAPSAATLSSGALSRAAAEEGGEPFVGRAAELAALSDAARSARISGGAVLVSGAAGAGKSALLARFRQRLRADGWTVVAGRCPEADGAPAAWAWLQALGTLAQADPPEPGSRVAAFLRDQTTGPAQPTGPDERSVGDATAGRFHLHRSFTAWLRAAGHRAPLAIFIDDLHRADAETLALVERAATTPALLVTAYRPDEAGDPLDETLAALAPGRPRRITLGGLPATDVGALVTAVCGTPVDAATVAALAERTGGNPFYVCESARLMASEGALVALSEVPLGVRDVVMRRLRRLPAAAGDVVRLVAVAGLDVELSVLLAASQALEEAVLDGVEAAVVAGLLLEPAPGRLRLEHALVRDAVYGDVPRVRRSRLHARLAAALQTLHPDDFAGLAHHYGQAGTAATAGPAVQYAVQAAQVAERRYAHDTAVTLLTQAIVAFGLAPAHETETLIDLLGRLMRAQVRAGAVLDARATRQQAVEAARASGRDDLLVAAYAAWTEPTPWQARPHGYIDSETLDTVERLTRRTDLDAVTRSRLLRTLVEELTGTADMDRLTGAAGRQLEFAEQTGDPELLASAIISMTRIMPHELQGARREPLAARLHELTTRHDLPAYRWAAEHLSGMIAATRGEPDRLRHHAEQGLDLARRYRLAEAEAVSLTTMAMLAHIQGRFADAEATYAAARNRLQPVASVHGTQLYAAGMVTVWNNQGRYAETETLLRTLHNREGSVIGPALAVALARQGRLDEARAVPCPGVRPVPDSIYGINLECRAERAYLLGDRQPAHELIQLMLPLADQLAGAAGTAFATRPIAAGLAELYLLTGDTGRAREMFALAEAVAERWGSAHLATAARTSARSH